MTGGAGISTPSEDTPVGEEIPRMAELVVRSVSALVEEGAFVAARVTRPSGGWLSVDTGEFLSDPVDAEDITFVLTEDTSVAGIWRGEVDFSDAVTGEVIVLAYNHRDEWLLERRIWVESGAPLASLARREALIHTDTGGAAYLIAEDAHGNPVEGATVRVYPAAAVADLDAAVPVGVTATDARGRWLAPVAVTAGETYIVHLQRAGEYGPVVYEVTV